jgi:hypothetical protein
MYDVPGSAAGRFESRRDSPALRSSVAVAESLWDIGCIVVELLSTEMPRRRCFGFVCTDCSSVWQQLHSEQRRLFFCLQNDLVKMPALVVRWICERKFGKNCQQFDGIKFCVTTLMFFGCLVCMLQDCGFCQVQYLTPVTRGDVPSKGSLQNQTGWAGFHQKQAPT